MLLLRYLQNNNRKRYFITFVAIMVLGIVTMLFSKALSSAISLQPEDGAATQTNKLYDSSASGFGAVRFGQRYNDIIVSPTGNDANNGGSEATAVKTLFRAAQLATGNSRIRIKAGNYVETFRIDQKSNIIIEPFGNGDVDIIGAIPEFLTTQTWENVQPGIYKRAIAAQETTALGSNTIYTSTGQQWWSYNALLGFNGLLARGTVNNLPGVYVAGNFLGGSDVYVATDDNQPPKAPLYIGRSWPTLDISDSSNIRINSIQGSRLKFSYGNQNIQIRNSNNVSVDDIDLTGGYSAVAAFDSSQVSIKNNQIRGKFGRDWNFSDVKERGSPFSMENSAILVRANTKDISNVYVEDNDISGYWNAIYYQTLNLSPTAPKFYNDNSVIARNKVYDMAGVGIETEALFRNLVIKNNIVYDSYEPYSAAPVREGPVYVYENLFVANRTQMFDFNTTPMGPGQAIKMNNDNVVPPENIHYYYNTFYYAGNDENAKKTVHTTPGVLTRNVAFINNIFYSLEGGILRGTGRAEDGVEFDGNIFYSEKASARKFFAWNSYYDENNSYASLSAIISGGKLPSSWQANSEGNPSFNCTDFTNSACFKPGSTIAKPATLQPIPSGFAESNRLNGRTTIGAFE